MDYTTVQHRATRNLNGLTGRLGNKKGTVIFFFYPDSVQGIALELFIAKVQLEQELSHEILHLKYRMNIFSACIPE